MVQRRKHPLSGASLGENVLLISGQRRTPKQFQADRKACHNRGTLMKIRDKARNIKFLFFNANICLIAADFHLHIQRLL